MLINKSSKISIFLNDNKAILNFWIAFILFNIFCYQVGFIKSSLGVMILIGDAFLIMILGFK